MERESDSDGPYRSAPTLASKPEVEDAPIVGCTELCLTYDGLRQSVDHITFSVAPHTIFALLGPNGAGKTSTLRMLAGLLEPTSGEALVDGVNVATQPEKARQLVGYLPDDFALYEKLTAVEQLQFFARLYGIEERVANQRIDELLGEFDLLGQKDRAIGEFSRGMKQRLGLAKTLLHQPKLLLLDEPASALDPGSRSRLRDSLLRLKEGGQTIIISSHILPDLAGLADSVGILERGKMVFAGPIDEATNASQQQVAYVLHTLNPSCVPQVFEDFGVRLRESVEIPQGFEVSVEGGASTIAELVEALTQAGARVCHVAPKESAIETVYRMSQAERVA